MNVLFHRVNVSEGKLLRFEKKLCQKCLLFCASCGTFNNVLSVPVDFDVSVTHRLCSSDVMLQEFNIQKSLSNYEEKK